MVIINQDLDQKFIKGNQVPFWHEVKNNGKSFGFNLTLGKGLLGTFDTVEEVEAERDRINSFKGDVYIVSGYSDYDGGEDFEELIQQFNQFNLHE